MATIAVGGLEPSPPEYDESAPSGGNPLEVNVNDPYALQEFHYTYLVFCAFIVWLIIPGIGLLYGGLARRKSSLALLFQSLLVASVTTFQWMFWGYSLAFSRTGNSFIGDLKNFGLMGVGVAPSPGSAYIPEVVFCLYQMFFCACTVQIVIGGAFERGRIVPSLVFSFLWATIVYCPIACWTWNSNGWLYNLPSLDYAGGGPVHIASGWSALAYAFVLGKRKHHGEKSHHKPHNTTLVFLGTVLIWFGWFGFNGGSALNGTVRSMYAAFNTNTAASTGVLGWVIIDFIRTGGKFSVVGACEGAIAGLIGITPAAGFTSLWTSALLGFITAVACNSVKNLNKWIGIDEGMDVFKLHGIGGMIGSFLTGIFAQQWVGALDGTSTGYSGAMDGVGIQVGRQLAEIVAIGAYAFTVSCILLYILKYIPGMNLRVSEEAEMIGLDLDQFFDEQIGDWTMVEQHAAINDSITPSSQHSIKQTSEIPKKAA
ncbi:ammonium transporter [Pseudovirgaria hyperparasitica]|uniref:Ammonium transporter n=1 Tax=Pseudovirgaria hyperparasitica TaxID=470096 RepID=A0A6A6VQQ7_9PEZI|nr:ammonium transporter [Pseudovirgaria hyperparasitica]KAF2752988.1 ammonium transporter [Pseudovirgaria hyperparasitica]